MPHINIKCYPKGLSEQQLQSFADELTTLASKHLATPKEYITIAYSEIPADEWQDKVYDQEIKPHADTLLRKPEYQM